MSWDEAIDKAWEVERNLTSEERYALLSGRGFGADGWSAKTSSALPWAGLPDLRMQDAAQGFRPLLDGEAGTATSFPSPLALAATWNEATVRRTAAALGREFRQKGANVILGPALNVHRTPWGGRNWEHLPGEDPYLGARLAPAFVQGVQSQGVIAAIGNFAFNDQETARQWQNSIVSWKTAWELYLPPFEAAIKAGAGAVRCATNRFNGSFVSESQLLLEDVLRTRMGFKGFVLAESESLHSAEALQRGVDMEQPESRHFKADAVAETGGDQAASRAARNILAAMYHVRLDKGDTCQGACQAERAADVGTQEHAALAEEAAAESIVLLQNDGVLPLDPAKLKTLAILGSASQPDALSQSRLGSPYSGAGEGHVPSPNLVTPLQALLDRASKAGMNVLNTDIPTVAAATRIVQQSDAVVIVATALTETGRDRNTLSLEDGMDSLISDVAELGKPVVVLLEVPGPVLMPWRREVSAIAALFYGGERTGDAWASILFGDRSPSGRLPVTMPSHSGGLVAPGAEDVVYAEGLKTSYRAPSVQVAFPFGHGLSYTLFEVEEPWAYVESCPAAACVTANVSNMGTRSGREVLQAYLNFADKGAYKLEAPLLRGFHKTRELRPGEVEQVTLAFTERDLSIYDESSGTWRFQEMVDVELATSSAHIRRKVEVLVPYRGGAARPQSAALGASLVALALLHAAMRQ